MPFATFADPTVAIEPPPQAWEYDTAIVSQLLSDPFGAPNEAPIATSGDKGWGDIAKDLGQNFLRDLAGAVGGKVAGTYVSPADPAALARAEADRKAETQKMFLIVGGVGLAVVLGALLLRGKR